MPVLDALTPLLLLLPAGAAAVLLICFAGKRRKKGGQLPRDPLAELFLDRYNDEEGE